MNATASFTLTRNSLNITTLVHTNTGSENYSTKTTLKQTTAGVKVILPGCGVNLVKTWKHRLRTVQSVSLTLPHREAVKSTQSSPCLTGPRSLLYIMTLY